MGGMCRVADQEFLQTNRGYAKILHLGAASVGVELEAHEPKEILPLYSVSYLCLKTHVQ